MNINDYGRWSVYERPQKEWCRNYAVEDLPRLQRSLWMAGESFRDIEIAKENKIIDKESQLVIPERDPEIIPLVENKIHSGRLVNNAVLHKGEISELKLPFSLQFAFLDFLGCYERHTVRWMVEEFAPKLEAGARVVITHMQGWRNNNFIHECENALWNVCGQKVVEVARNLRSECKELITRRKLAVVISTARCIFNRHSFIDNSVIYRDSRNSMFMLRLDNFQPLPTGETNGWPDITDLVKLSKGTKMKKKNSTGVVQKKDRSKAAYKAWETRRQNDKNKCNSPSENKFDQIIRLLQEIKNERSA